MIGLLLLLILPVERHRDCCDVVEVNHVYAPDGGFIFDQWICWTWNTAEARHDVRDWRIIHDARRVCETDQREWRRTHPDGPPYEPKWLGSTMVPSRVGGRRLCHWYDRKCRVYRTVEARMVRETWTSYDPELQARELLAETDRRHLR